MIAGFMPASRHAGNSYRTSEYCSYNSELRIANTLRVGNFVTTPLAGQSSSKKWRSNFAPRLYLLADPWASTSRKYRHRINVACHANVCW
eukprot:scaffold194947_cov47-Prasinocladus_malaysianus.AAC.2